MRFCSLAFIIWVTAAQVVPSTTQQPLTRPAGSDIEAFVKRALENRLAAYNLPDLALLRGSLRGAVRIPVRPEMPRSGIVLGPNALPRRSGSTFYFLSRSEAQTEADKSGRVVHRLATDEATISGDTATVWLGVDAVAPRVPKVGLLCCCRGLAQFQRVEGNWAFVKWLQHVCS
jgi:hypothetical protein